MIVITAIAVPTILVRRPRAGDIRVCHLVPVNSATTELVVGVGGRRERIPTACGRATSDGDFPEPWQITDGPRQNCDCADHV